MLHKIHQGSPGEYPKSDLMNSQPKKVETFPDIDFDPVQSYLAPIDNTAVATALEYSSLVDYAFVDMTYELFEKPFEDIFKEAVDGEVPLNQVSEPYKEYFSSHPEEVEKLKENPVGFWIHQLLSGEYVQNYLDDPEEIKEYLQDNAFYFEEVNAVLEHFIAKSGYSIGDKAVPDGKFTRETHLAFTAFLKDMAQSQPLPKPQPEKLSALGTYFELRIPETHVLTANQVLTSLTDEGVPEPLAKEMIIGMTRLTAKDFKQQSQHLLNPDIREDLASALNELATLYKKGHLKKTSLEDIGQLLLTQHNLHELTSKEGEYDILDHSLNSAENFKTRLVIYLTLSEAGGQYSEIAEHIRDGHINIFPEDDDDDAHASYISKIVFPDLNDAFFFNINSEKFQHTTIENLFDHHPFSREFRGYVIHESIHALDDKFFRDGIHLPNFKIESDPLVGDEEHPQHSAETEFNAYYAQVLYVTNELLELGQYSQGAVLASMGRLYHDQSFHYQKLTDFIDKHHVQKKPFTPAELNQFFNEIKQILIDDIGYSDRPSPNDGIISQKRYLDLGDE